MRSPRLYNGDMITIEQLMHVNDADIEDFHKLLPQLVPHPDIELGLLPERLEHTSALEDVAIMVARNEDGRIVGTATGDSVDVGIISDLVVDAPLRRQGIATQLVQEMHTWFQGRFCSQAEIMCEPDRLAAIGLAESLGYTHQRPYVVHVKNLATRADYSGVMHATLDTNMAHFDRYSRDWKNNAKVIAQVVARPLTGEQVHVYVVGNSSSFEPQEQALEEMEAWLARNGVAEIMYMPEMKCQFEGFSQREAAFYRKSLI